MIQTGTAVFRPTRVRWFPILTAAVPTLLLVLMRLGTLIMTTLEPDDGLAPFEQSAFLYVPNWLEVATTIGAYLSAAWAYLVVVHASGARVIR